MLVLLLAMELPRLLLILPAEVLLLGTRRLVEVHLWLSLIEGALVHVVFVVPEFVKMVSEMSKQISNLSVAEIILLIVLPAVLKD